MKIRIVLVVALLSVARFASAQILEDPPMNRAEFKDVKVFEMGVWHLSPGWDQIRTVKIEHQHVIRFFTRRFDGLTVAVLADRYGTIIGQSDAWNVPINVDIFDVTPVEIADTWDRVITYSALVFAYSRWSGIGTNQLVMWFKPTGVVDPFPVPDGPGPAYPPTASR